MSNLLNLFRERGAEEAIRLLTEVYKVTVKRCSKNPFVLVDYSQIESPRKHPIVDECRGAIIDISDESFGAFACRPFTRFYNYGEHPELEKDFKWENAVCYEKLDGSLIKVWFNKHEERWEIGTRGTFYADSEISTLLTGKSSITFRDLFFRALDIHDEEQFQHVFDQNFFVGETILFELCTLENKVVTSYNGDKVFLLEILKNHSMYTEGACADDIQSAVYDINLTLGNDVVLCPPVHEVTSFKEAVEKANSLGGLREGFVVQDGDGRRLKIKSEAYVTAHHLRGEGVTPKRAVLLALSGELYEFCAYFPEYLELLTPYQERVDQIRVDVPAVYEQIKHIEDQKEFAKHATQHKFSAALFAMRKGLTFEEFVDKMSDQGKISFFGPQ